MFALGLESLACGPASCSHSREQCPAVCQPAQLAAKHRAIWSAVPTHHLCRVQRLRCQAGIALSDEDEGAADDDSLARARASLDRMMNDQHITGSELRSLILRKWGRSYDARLQKRGNRTYFHVMWKYLEQRSFPLSESQYMEQLNAVAECLTEWGAASAVRSGIDRAHSKGPGYTGGGGARAISIPLETRGQDEAFWRS